MAFVSEMDESEYLFIYFYSIFSDKCGVPIAYSIATVSANRTLAMAA